MNVHRPSERASSSIAPTLLRKMQVQDSSNVPSHLRIGASAIRTPKLRHHTSTYRWELTEDELSCRARKPKRRALSSFSVFSGMSRAGIRLPVVDQAQDTRPNWKMLGYNTALLKFHGAFRGGAEEDRGQSSLHLRVWDTNMATLLLARADRISLLAKPGLDDSWVAAVQGLREGRPAAGEHNNSELHLYYQLHELIPEVRAESRT